MYQEYSITSDYLTVVFYYTRLLNSSLKNSNSLTIPQFRIMNYLYSCKSAPAVSEAALALNLTPGTVSFILKKLEAAGYLFRQEDEFKHSIIHIELTETGVKAIEFAQSLANKVNDSMWEPLGDFLKKEALKGATPSNYDVVSRTQGVLEINDLYLNSSLLAENKSVEILNEFGIGISEFRVLFELQNHPTGLKPTELANMLLLKLADISTACNKLLKRNLINRSREGYDKRTVIVEITNEGYARSSEIARCIDEMIRETFSSSTDQERDHQNKAAHLMVSTQRKRFRYS